MKTVAVVGVGLIGASFALALRKAGFEGETIGVSSPGALEDGIKAGAISRGASLSEAAAVADLIYLSQPIDAILTTLESLGPLARPDCLITDAGSTKAAIVAKAAAHFRFQNFLGGHPMAGKEQRGAIAADADLFRGRPYVLTPATDQNAATESAIPRRVEFRDWLRRIGANVIEMDAATHDSTVALTSHLPQVLSTALAATLAGQSNPYIPLVFGPGLIDMTRLSLSAPEVWLSVLATNKDPVLEAIGEFKASLNELEYKLRYGSIVDQFTKAASFSGSLRKLPSTK